eukprot:7383483-Prymnesium_polylepis.1
MKYDGMTSLQLVCVHLTGYAARRARGTSASVACMLRSGRRARAQFGGSKSERAPGSCSALRSHSLPSMRASSRGDTR